MSVLTYIHHFVVSNLLTVYYNFYAIFVMTVCLLKNPFKSLWPQKKRLIPPSPLSDPKYGVHKYIKVNNDTKLHYVESGDTTKPLMIFVHGYPEFWYSWRHQILEFKKDYWCIAVDLRGYGDSERPDGLASYDIELLVEDLRDLVRQLCRQKCILVSHDWGGLISCRFRDVHPDALIALVMLSSTSREAWFHELWQNPAQRKMSWYVFLYRMPVIPELFMQIYDLVMLEKALLVPGKDTITNEDVECYKYWFSKQYALTPPINYYRSNFLFSLPEKKYKEEKIPMLVANAQNDAYLNRELLNLMKKEYAHIETSIVEGCGHFLQQEEPTKVNKLIRDFLSKNKL